MLVIPAEAGIHKRPMRRGKFHTRRFTLAHELCHLIFDREAGRRLALASGPWAPKGIERRANAFAAMLLMPAGVVRKTLPKLAAPVNTKGGIADAARRLQVGVPSLLHHVTNLGFMDESDRRRIEEELLAPDEA